MAAPQQPTKQCQIVLHDKTASNEVALVGSGILKDDEIAFLDAPGATTLVLTGGRVAASHPDEISVNVAVAKRFGFENRMRGTVRIIEDAVIATATHVELLFRDQYLSRADMWSITAMLNGSTIYRGQKIRYLGSVAAEIEHIYISGREVRSAYVVHPRSKLIFRSGSARYTILIQVSKELLEYWSGDDILYESLCGGFLPTLFRRWDSIKARHQVSVVLFGRQLGEEAVGDTKNGAHRDFFHVICSETPSGDWRDVIPKVRAALSNPKLPRTVSLAADGNLLEALHWAALDYADDTIDPHLGSTGTSVIAVTAGTGIFLTQFDLLKRTTELLMGNSIGVDIVSLSPKPLHPVPLFQYLHDGNEEFALPHWVDISYWKAASSEHESAWLLPSAADAELRRVALPRMPPIASTRSHAITSWMEKYDAGVFKRDPPELRDAPLATSQTAPTVGSLGSEGNNHAGAIQTRNPEVDRELKIMAPYKAGTNNDGRKASVAASVPSIDRGKREGLPFHPLLQSNRKISVGPRGLAPSRGVASTTVSVQHAQHERSDQFSELVRPSLSTVNTGKSTGIMKQIRASLARRPSQQSLVSQAPSDVSQQTQIEIPQTSSHLSRPINIQTGEQDEPAEEELDQASAIERNVMALADKSEPHGSATPQGKRDSLPLPGVNALEDEHGSIAPWLTLLNPCNPRRSNMRVASEYRKWQNVFPRAVGSGFFKWDSMCTPAALPLLTEFRITTAALEKHFDKKVRRLLASSKKQGQPATARQVMIEILNLRLSAGFQIIPARRPGRLRPDLDDIDRVLLHLGSSYHEIKCLSQIEVQVIEFERKTEAVELTASSTTLSHDMPAIVQGVIDRHMRPFNLRLVPGVLDANWQELDDQAVNPAALAEHPGNSRMRFVLIPVAFNREQAGPRTKDLSDEERRIDGIQKLTQLWQRHRFFTAEQQRSVVSSKKTKRPGVDRDPNPLSIEYQTRDPAAAVLAYGSNIIGKVGDIDDAPLGGDSDQYSRNNFDLTKLIKHMQELPPIGVEVKDRRWFTRMHTNCFRGDEMTNWLIRVFKDLDTRDAAVALGNQLMDEDIFTHVRGKHLFRDGNYFYQIRSPHRTTEYPDNYGLFGKAGRSMPATPMAEHKRSPSVKPADLESSGSRTPAGTPTLPPTDSKRVMLSEVLQFNVDALRKSDQAEIVNLHYDRVHNPDNCYHIQLDWTSATPKLIREAVGRWTSLVESHGLKVVQVPLCEATGLHEKHPFDVPLFIKLALNPPDRVLATPSMDPRDGSLRTQSLISQGSDGYHKALLRKFDFVLDFEAANAFPAQPEVRYSWGPPSYKYTQFIHKSGALLAQITNDVRGDFALLLNRKKLDGSEKEKQGPVGQSQQSLETVVQNFRRMCRDTKALRSFYDEASRPKMVAHSPWVTAMTAGTATGTPTTGALQSSSLPPDVDIPPMSLPPHMNHRGFMNNL